MAERIHSQNFLVLPCVQGWILCRTDQSLEVCPLIQGPCPWGQLKPPPFQWKSFMLQDDNQQVHLCVVPGLDVNDLLLSMGLDLYPDVLSQASPVWSQPGSRPSLPLPSHACVEVPSIPALTLKGLCQQPVPDHPAPFVVVLGRQAAYVFAKGGPCQVAVLNHIFAYEVPGHAVPHHPVWTTLDGRELPSWRMLSGVVALHFVPEDDCWQQPSCSASTICAVEVTSPRQPVSLRMQPCGPLQDQLSFPVLTFRGLGWDVRMTPSHVPVNFLFCPRHYVFRLPVSDILPTCAIQLVAGALNFLQACQTAVVPVQVQLSGHTFWQGKLPGHITFQDVLDLWELCHLRLCCRCQCRPYSGHRPMDPTCTLVQACYEIFAGGSVTRQGFLKVTLAAPMSGPDDKERGLALSEATAVTDKLMPQAGVGRVVQLLKPTISGPTSKASVGNSMFHVRPWTPPLTVPNAGSVPRPNAKVRPPKTSHPGFFNDADGTPAHVLGSPFPDITGVVLCDPQEAKHHLELRQRASCDELALVVLGLVSPDQSSCSGEITFPALNSAQEPVLLKGCLRQLGEGKVFYKCAKDVQVTLNDLCCCAFTACKADWREEEWTGLLAAPAKRMLEVFSSSGVPQAFESPWGRSYRDANLPVLPAAASSIQMHGKVLRSNLDQVLRRSGHNRIYVTPKTWSHEVSGDFQIVWVAADRSAVQAALSLPSQYGVVHAKGRYGVRIAASAFETAYRALKPSEPLPPQITVRMTFKVFFVPPGTRGSDLVQWGKQLGWVKALRSVGPRQWLIGAACAPPGGLHSINNQPILITPHTQRQPQGPVVSAGRPSRASLTKADAESPDPWQKTDLGRCTCRSKVLLPSRSASCQRLRLPASRSMQRAWLSLKRTLGHSRLARLRFKPAWTPPRRRCRARFPASARTWMHSRPHLLSSSRTTVPVYRQLSRRNSLRWRRASWS